VLWPKFIILATQEVETGRIMVEEHLEQ
jgi:hypothetical protein